jgi:hypothetical protein
LDLTGVLLVLLINGFKISGASLAQFDLLEGNFRLNFLLLDLWPFAELFLEFEPVLIRQKCASVTIVSHQAA